MNEAAQAHDEDPNRPATIAELRELAAALEHSLTPSEIDALDDDFDPEAAHAEFASYSRAMAARRKKR